MKAIKRWMDEQDERWTVCSAILGAAALVLLMLAMFTVAGILDNSTFSIFNG